MAFALYTDRLVQSQRVGVGGEWFSALPRIFFVEVLP
jgi:hypothetical protein